LHTREIATKKAFEKTNSPDFGSPHTIGPWDPMCLQQLGLWPKPKEKACELEKQKLFAYHNTNKWYAWIPKFFEKESHKKQT
jgi:hypothetical protein